jgi:hypothetical protein
VLEQGQRIAALHPRPRKPRLRARPGRFDISLPRHGGTRQLGDVVIHPARVNLAGNEIRVGQDVVQKRDVCIDAVDPEFAQRTSGARHRGHEIWSGRMRDHLRQKRVECARRTVARIAEPVGPHAGATRRLVRCKCAAAGVDAAVGAHGLHVDARLDGEAAQCRLPIKAEFIQRTALRKQDFCLHQIDARHFLGDCVLHLQPRIRLDEYEGLHPRLARCVQQKLERAKIGVAHAFRETHGRFETNAGFTI